MEMSISYDHVRVAGRWCVCLSTTFFSFSFSSLWVCVQVLLSLFVSFSCFLKLPWYVMYVPHLEDTRSYVTIQPNLIYHLMITIQVWTNKGFPIIRSINFNLSNTRLILSYYPLSDPMNHMDVFGKPVRRAKMAVS